LTKGYRVKRRTGRNVCPTKDPIMKPEILSFETANGDTTAVVARPAIEA